MDAPSAPAANGQLAPQTARGLARLAARADEIELLLDGFGALIARGPVIADNLNDTVEQVRRANAGRGDGALTEQLPRLKALATPERAADALDAAEALTGALADPDVKAFLRSDLARTLATLGRLAGRLDELEALLDMATGALRRGPEIAETLNDTLNQVRRDVAKQGSPLAAYAPALAELKSLAEPERVAGLLRLGGLLQEALESEGVQALLHSTILDPQAVETVSELATSVVRATQEAPSRQMKVTGPISTMRALNDPHVSRALSFVFNVAQAFGQQLEQDERRRLGAPR